MSNNNDDTAETQTEILIPNNYYDNSLGSANFNSFSLSIILGLLIAILFFMGLKR